MLNYYDLGLLQVGLKSFMILVDNRDYMGSSLGTWLLDRSFLHLNSYNLVGSVTVSMTYITSSVNIHYRQTCID